jgi:beta-glucosidase
MRGRTYRYFTGTPLYPFGFGLSYSDFRYSNLDVNSTGVTVRITNASDRDGDEVVQLYTTPRDNPRGLIRQLAGFERIHLKANESRTVTLPLPSGLKEINKISVGGIEKNL